MIKGDKGLLLLLLCLLTSLQVSAQKSEMDAVICHHFSLVDSAIVLLDRNDSILLKYDYHTSMSFLEEMSRIKADRKQDYSAAPILSEGIIVKWRNWFSNNYDKLIWFGDKVKRKDYNAYSSQIKPSGVSLAQVNTRKLPSCILQGD